MKKIAFFDFNNKNSYIFALAIHLGPEYVSYYADKLNKEKKESLSERGFTIENISAFDIENHMYLFAENYEDECFKQECFLKNNYAHKFFSQGNDTNLKRITYQNQLAMPTGIGDQGLNLLLPTQDQVLFIQSTLKAFVNSLSPTALISYANTNRDHVAIASSGFLDLYDHTMYKTMEKAKCIALLEAELQVTFNKNLPIISYFRDGFNRERIVERSLLALAEYAHVLIVDNNTAYPSILKEKPNITLCSSINKSLIYNAVDFNLVGAASQELKELIALQLKVIPVFTQKLDTMQKCGKILDAPLSTREAHLKRFVRFVNIFCKGPYSTPLSYFAPIDIEAIEMLIERINDVDYWEKYEQNIANLSKVLYGDYPLENVIEHNAILLKNLLKYNSFFPPIEIL